MDDSALALTAARARIAIGCSALLMPRMAARFLGAKPGTEGVSPVLTRMLGGRDVALGLGTVIALDRGKPVRGWLEGAALADAVDCLAALLGRRALSPFGWLAGVGGGGGSAALHAYLSRRLDPAPAAHPGQPEAIVTGHPSGA